MSVDYEGIIDRGSEVAFGHRPLGPDVSSSESPLTELYCPKLGDVVQVNILGGPDGKRLVPEPAICRIEGIGLREDVDEDDDGGGAGRPVVVGEIVLKDTERGYRIPVPLESFMRGRSGLLEIHLPQED